MARPTILLLLLCAAALPALASEDGDGRRCSWCNDSEFAWQVQADLPAKGLGRALDEETGLGLGAQWTTFRSGGFANRFRLEWNVFPTGNPVAPDNLKSSSSNYIASFDRLYHLSGGSEGLYILGGLGAVRWFMTQGPEGGPQASWHATKLEVTGGVGYRFNHHVSLEARYMVSSFNGTFDANLLQGSLGVRF
jgi:hypothetical protein